MTCTNPEHAPFHRRIAELETKCDRFVCEKVDLGAKVVELEAELAEAKRRIYWLRRLKMPDSDALAKANKEWSELLGDAEIRAEKAEAEVERLRAVCDSQNLLIEVKERDDG